MQTILINQLQKKISGRIALPSSKSESNRTLIIEALAQYQQKTEGYRIDNISEARDTQTMLRLLATTSQTLDVLDAGTTMRFLTAYCTVTNRKAILTGTERMCQRPIGILVEALKSMGATIHYLNKEGYPPIEISEFIQKENTIHIRGDVSSQYISALLMIAPLLPMGLNLVLEGKIGSKPYIQMTLDLMDYFGIQYQWEENRIKIEGQRYILKNYQIESDWSGASYWYSMVALAEEAEIELSGLKENSLQGDKAIVAIGELLGVKSVFTNTGVKLSKTTHQDDMFIDFTHCPDLAQTVVVCCAAKGISLKMKGLESLRIKETDRIQALQNELQKMGYDILEESVDGALQWQLVKLTDNFPNAELKVHTYEDHRMAMAFAPLACLQDIEIETPEVVAKSYPQFWENLEEAGFEINDTVPGV